MDPDFARLYAEAPCGLIVTTGDGTITVVNDTILTWTGLDRDAMLGRRFVDLLTPGGRLYHETHFMPLVQMQEGIREIALEIVGAGRSRIPVLVNANAVRDDAGAIAEMHIALFAASERREYERELMRAKRKAEDSEAHANLLARTLQTTLIPPALPRVDGLDLGAVYRPAGSGEEVGGDFYDVFQVSADDWVVAIGDVCGKGVDAAIVTALVRYTTRAAAVEHAEAGRVLEVVNDVLIRHDTERFCTVALLRLRRRAGTWNVTIALGGHPFPLLRRDDGPELTEAGRPGLLLGVFASPQLPEHTVELRSGDSLVLYTDGVTEGRAGDEFFGEERLEAAVLQATGDAQQRAEAIAGAVLDFQSHQTRDDLAVIVIRA